MDIIYILTGLALGAGSAFVAMRPTASRLKETQNALEELRRRYESDRATLQEAVIEKSAQEKIAARIQFDMDKLRQEYSALDTQFRKLISENASLSTSYDALLDKQELLQTELEEKRSQMEKEFRLMANSILDEKSKKFTELNTTELSRILEPLKENLVQFKSKVEETYDKESKQRFSLEEKIRELVELNNQISEDARNLTKALKGDSKVQGDWGEMILETILEKSGLQKNREYFIQPTMKDASGKSIQTEEGKMMRPDVIIAYPDNRNIIVDSKVSLTAYIRFTEAENKEVADKALSEHLRSVKAHIDELSRKSYQDYTSSLDFVMMFIPNEPAFMLALQSDQNLWQYAYDKRVLLISPTNLITALKLVADLWKRENQSRNAIEIAERGGKLYDKFVGLAKQLDLVGEQLDKTTRIYEAAMGQLRDKNGNLIGQVEKLKELGVKAKKQIALTEVASESDEPIV
ncbi:MAG: DNA recombination protein RmuC [Bacteroidales bacterium]